MNKTKIEWVKNPDGTQGYTVNPVKGLCPMACSYCYARRMYKRFKWNPMIEWDESCLESLSRIKKPSRIFIGSTMELFGDWVGFNAINYIINYVKDYPQHTFIFLTKQPTVMSQYIFPDNCWVGVSATNPEQYYDGVSNIAEIDAKIKFVSFEPLLEQINGGECSEEYRLDSIDEFDWVIIGQQTPVKQTTMPKIGWIEEIVKACDKARIPVFLKNNLRELLIPDALMDNIFWVDERAKLRQELPR